MASTSSTREKYLYMAKLAEQAESYDDMVEFMDKVCSAADSEDQELTVEERNLLSVAYKSMMGTKRASWRAITSIEQKEESLNNEDKLANIREFRSMIESHLCNICDDVLNLLDSRLIPSVTSTESKVFYLKMKGDYYRYRAEFKTSGQRKESIEGAMAAYKSAEDIANVELSPSHPFRLGLALNISVFYYEILDATDRACEIAKEALEESVSEMDEQSDKDSVFLMQLLHDNLALWTSDTQDDESD